MEPPVAKLVKLLFTFQLFKSLHSAITGWQFSCDPWDGDNGGGERGPNDIFRNDHFDCIADGPINCQSNNNCFIYCEEDIWNVKQWNPSMTNALSVMDESCAGITINCPDNAFCDIDCRYSCNGITVNAQTSTYLDIYNCGTTPNGCDDMTIWCPQPTDINNLQQLCSITSNTANTMHGLNIHSQQSFSEFSFTTSNIIGNNTMHCGLTTTEHSCIIDTIAQSQCQSSTGACQDYIFTASPTQSPTANPSNNPTITPTNNPTRTATLPPSFNPSTAPIIPTFPPTGNPTIEPTIPTIPPTIHPTITTYTPSIPPTNTPTSPTLTPTNNPSKNPTKSPSNFPTLSPTNNPSKNPSIPPTKFPTIEPTIIPTEFPTIEPTISPTLWPGFITTGSKGLINDDNRMAITIGGILLILILSIIVISFCVYLLRKYKYNDTKIKTIEHGIQLSPASPSTYDNHARNTSQHLRVTSVSNTQNMLFTSKYDSPSPPATIDNTIADMVVMSASIDNHPDLPPEPKSLIDNLDLPPSLPPSNDINDILLSNKSSKRLEGMGIIHDEGNHNEEHENDDDEEQVITQGAPTAASPSPQAQILYNEQMIAVKKHNEMNNVNDESESDDVYEPYHGDATVDVQTQDIKTIDQLIDDNVINVSDVIGNDAQNNSVVTIKKGNDGYW